MKTKHPSNQPANISGKTAEWIRTDPSVANYALISRFPNHNEKISHIREFVVKECENAILLQHGEFLSVMDPGTYEIDRKSRQLGTEIIWIDTSVHSIPWGIPQMNGIRTKDGFTLGLFGDLKIMISKPVSFYKYVVGGNLTWNLFDLKTWIKSVLHTALRDLLLEYVMVAILKEKRENIQTRISGKLAEEFYSYGLVLEDFNILGFKSPAMAQPILDADQEITMAQHQHGQRIHYHRLADREIIENRIRSLKARLRDLEDQLIDNQITKENFKEKRTMLALFLQEAEEEYKSKKTIPSSKAMQPQEIDFSRSTNHFLHNGPSDPENTPNDSKNIHKISQEEK